MSIFGRTNVVKYSPDQLRDEYGRWETDSSGQRGHETADTVDAAQFGQSTMDDKNVFRQGRPSDDFGNARAEFMGKLWTLCRTQQNCYAGTDALCAAEDRAHA